MRWMYVLCSFYFLSPKGLLSVGEPLNIMRNLFLDSQHFYRAFLCPSMRPLACWSRDYDGGHLGEDFIPMNLINNSTHIYFLAAPIVAIRQNSSLTLLNTGLLQQIPSHRHKPIAVFLSLLIVRWSCKGREESSHFLDRLYASARVAAAFPIHMLKLWNYCESSMSTLTRIRYNVRHLANTQVVFYFGSIPIRNETQSAHSRSTLGIT